MARARNIKPSLICSEGMQILSKLKDFFFSILKSGNDCINVIGMDLNYNIISVAMFIKLIWITNANGIYLIYKNLNAKSSFDLKCHFIAHNYVLRSKFTLPKSSLQAPYKELKSHA